MRIVLQKLSDARHALEIVRGDRVERKELETRSFLTHDLLHYAVEREADLHGGFWGSLASGTTDADDLMQIELVAGLRRNAEAFPLPAWLTVAFVTTVQERMRQLLGQWHATPFGGAMELTWPA